MVKLSVLIFSVLLLTACDEDYKSDNTPIARNDFALIQLETDICKGLATERSCLKHLKGRIQ